MVELSAMVKSASIGSEAEARVSVIVHEAAIAV
jgi:hypothetical protein